MYKLKCDFPDIFTFLEAKACHESHAIRASHESHAIHAIYAIMKVVQINLFKHFDILFI